MAIMIGNGEAVELHRYVQGSRNAHNKPKPTFETSVVTGVGVDVPDVDETDRGTGDRQTIAARIFLPAGMTVAKQDEFTVRGLRYGVDGEAPMAIKNFFTGAMFPTEVRLKRVTG